MNVLMTIAVAGAMAIGEWGEGASTVVLFSLAQLLEARSLERARRAISGLLSLAPETALVRRNGVDERVAAADVARGEHVFVKPGERVPLDGVVVAGASDLDQSPLTGESRPVPRGEGDGVFAGSINGAGALEVRVTRRSGETTLARVLRRVEEAQSSRAPSQGFVESFAKVYTPAVVALAVLLAVAPPLLGYGTLAAWTYRALVLLVIACPCALVISTPVSIVSALTAASRRGILVKGGAHLEEIGRVREMIFDKTGTLTRGRPRVADVIALEPGREDEVVSLAASVESRGAHPIGEALVAYALESGVPMREVAACATTGWTPSSSASRTRARRSSSSAWRTRRRVSPASSPSGTSCGRRRRRRWRTWPRWASSRRCSPATTSARRVRSRPRWASARGRPTCCPRTRSFG